MSGRDSSDSREGPTSAKHLCLTVLSALSMFVLFFAKHICQVFDSTPELLSQRLSVAFLNIVAGHEVRFLFSMRVPFDGMSCLGIVES